MFRFVKTLFQRSAAEYVRDDCGALAASISYYTLFSLFPLLIVVVAIAGLLIQDRGVQQDIVDEVLKNIPLNEGEGRDSVTNAVRDVAVLATRPTVTLSLSGLGVSRRVPLFSRREAFKISLHPQWLEPPV